MGNRKRARRLRQESTTRSRLSAVRRAVRDWHPVLTPALIYNICRLVFVLLHLLHEDSWVSVLQVSRIAAIRNWSHIFRHCKGRMFELAITRPDGSSLALPEWKEHRGMQPVLPVGVAEDRDQIVFFKLNGQE